MKFIYRIKGFGQLSLHEAYLSAEIERVVTDNLKDCLFRIICNVLNLVRTII